MAAIGSLQFCSTCGNLLTSPTSAKRKPITCTVCQTANKDLTAKSIVTVSKPSDFPSVLRSKRSQVQTVNAEDVQTQAMSSVACEVCGVKEVRYRSVQMRSADEGSTMLYNCEACGHTYVEFWFFWSYAAFVADPMADGRPTIEAPSAQFLPSWWEYCLHREVTATKLPASSSDGKLIVAIDRREVAAPASFELGHVQRYLDAFPHNRLLVILKPL